MPVLDAHKALKDLLDELGEHGFVGTFDNGKKYAYFDREIDLEVLNYARRVLFMPEVTE